MSFVPHIPIRNEDNEPYALANEVHIEIEKEAIYFTDGAQDGDQGEYCMWVLEEVQDEPELAFTIANAVKMAKEETSRFLEINMIHYLRSLGRTDLPHKAGTRIRWVVSGKDQDNKDAPTGEIIALGSYKWSYYVYLVRTDEPLYDGTYLTLLPESHVQVIEGDESITTEKEQSE